MPLIPAKPAGRLGGRPARTVDAPPPGLQAEERIGTGDRDARSHADLGAAIAAGWGIVIVAALVRRVSRMDLTE
jgi:hypothetical protein